MPALQPVRFNKMDANVRLSKILPIGRERPNWQILKWSPNKEEVGALYFRKQLLASVPAFRYSPPSSGLPLQSGSHLANESKFGKE